MKKSLVIFASKLFSLYNIFAQYFSLCAKLSKLKKAATMTAYIIINNVYQII